MKTIIIGGGAAGMAAAIAAAQKGDRVIILERGRKAMKKLSVTGNGRGNLLNCGEPEYYGDTAFAMEVLRHMPYGEIAAFLESCGIPLTEESEGRMYPASYLASTAVDALRLTAERLGIETIVNTRADGIRREGGTFRIAAIRSVYAEDTPRKSGKMKPGALIGEEPCAFTADRVIVTVGGAAAPMHGTDGASYGLLEAFGHTRTALKPALCALTTEKKPIEGLTGQRVRARLALMNKQGIVHESAGEALFAEDGVSGIAAMQLSRFWEEGCVLCMDLREAVTGQPQADVSAWLCKRAQRCQNPQELLVGAATNQLASALWRMADVKPSLSPDALSALARAIARFTLKATGTRGFDSAQVTAGGIRPSEFDPSTLQSRLCKGLYAAGEVLDVDGGCGGYNLMFAFASGMLAGRA